MLPKWNKDLEKEIIENEINNHTYRFIDDENKKLYSIDTPPPYTNTPVHIGQATTYAIMDIIARYKRLKGFKVIFPLGLDRNGLPIEMEAEKKFKITTETPRKEYIEKCKEMLNKSSSDTSDIFKMIGISFNEWEENSNIGSLYMTDSDKYRALTQTTFIDLYKKGLIYEDEKITNYCPGCKTTIADSEIVYKVVNSTFYTILFEIKETGEKIPIATTRPELICSLGMVVFNPDDEQWKHLENKTVISPIFKKEVPIKAHPIAKMGKGTGLVMMCSAGDYSDIRFFIEQNIKPIISIDISGKMNKNAQMYEGLTIRECRVKIIDDLKKENLVTEEKKIEHKVPTCERSSDEIEFISLKEFYLKQMDYVKDIRKIANELKFANSATKKILLDWLEVIAIDWPISRRRYYATEIPLWYCKFCNEVILGERNKYQKPWCENPPVKECPKCKSKEFVGETKVLDTWFDSSNTALYIQDYDNDFFKKNPVCSLRPQGKEIVRTWLYYTLLKAYLLTGNRIFDDVYIHQHIVDEKGNKMSKSKGNGIDPLKTLNESGAESFRLWGVSDSNLSHKDVKCSKEKILSEQKTLNKIWNIGNFISMFNKKSENKTLTETDLWIRKEINEIVKFCEKAYNDYDLQALTTRLKNFIWTTFSSHYLELVKNRAYNQEQYFSEEEQNGAIDTLNYCYKKLLFLIYPIIPFTTKRLLKELYNIDIDKESYPLFEKYDAKLSNEDIELLNNTIWKYKKENNLSLKENIKNLSINNNYKNIEKDIIKTHNVSNIHYINEKEIKVNVHE